MLHTYLKTKRRFDQLKEKEDEIKNNDPQIIEYN